MFCNKRQKLAHDHTVNYSRAISLSLLLLLEVDTFMKLTNISTVSLVARYLIKVQI